MKMHRFTLDFSNGLRLTNLPIKHTKISTKSSELQAGGEADWGLTHVFGDAPVPLLVHGPEQLLKWSLLRCIRVVSLFNWTTSPMNSAKDSLPSKSRSISSKKEETSSLRWDWVRVYKVVSRLYIEVWQPEEERTCSHCSLDNFPSPSLSTFVNIFLIWRLGAEISF